MYILMTTKGKMTLANVRDLTLLTITNCMSLKTRYSYSWWDSLILSSALESSCTIVYSEDMQHGQVIENSLKIISPLL
jgi:predicted nucleic acid-binding protein